MKLKLRNLTLLQKRDDLCQLPDGKLLINTINAHSYNTAQKDQLFADSLSKCDVLLADGVSILIACRCFGLCKVKQRCTGWDLFTIEMNKLNEKGGKVMFVGSSEHVLSLIRQKAASVYPNLEVVTYSPPYKSEFSEEDNAAIVTAINEADPDLLWIGMTAPKQEKWAYGNWDRLDIHCHVGSIGAVFDFFAGTFPRAPFLWQHLGLEWLYRLIKDPKRMWRRYIIGNPLFLWNILKERISY